MSDQAAGRGPVRGALVASAVLVVAAPTPLESLRTLADTGAAQVVTDPLVALVALLAWCCAAYLLLVAALTVGSSLPGAAGRVLAALTRRTAPAGLRRALEVALGASLVVGGLGGTATAAPLGTASSGLVAQTTAGPLVPAPLVAPLPAPLDHPVTPDPTSSPGPAPSLDHPVAAAPVADAPSPSLDHPVAPDPAPSLDHPVADAPAPSASPTAAAATSSTPSSTAPASSGSGPVVVQPGDSLWSLAEDHLERQTGVAPSEAQVAQAWPSWWQANREAVGEDPDLLHPGTPLVPPTDPSSRPSSS